MENTSLQTTSFQRFGVVSTSIQRCFNVMCRLAWLCFDGFMSIIRDIRHLNVLLFFFYNTSSSFSSIFFSFVQGRFHEAANLYKKTNNEEKVKNNMHLCDSFSL